MFALIHNNKIKVGPRNWLRPFFQEYIDKNNLNYSLAFGEPTGPIITDTFKILKVTEISTPSVDSPFEQLAGPYWTIHDDHITGYYVTAPVEISAIKNILKATVTDKRYQVEVGGCEHTFADGQTVDIYTTREDRSVYVEALFVLPENSTITFKFKNENWRTLTKQELSDIVATGAAHVSGAFAWEKQKHDEIDVCTTVEELKAVELKHPNQLQGNGV